MSKSTNRRPRNASTYLERGGEQVFQPPYVAEGVQFFGFVVKADETCLQAICDRYLNGPSGTQDFVPFGPFVMFVFNKIARMYAKLPPDRDRGWYSEQEGAVWMPVWSKNRGTPFWYHPYMVVDSSYAMAMGREIYGFPKEIGWFDVPDGPNAPQTMHVDTVVVKDLDHDCQAKRKQLFCARIAQGARSNSATPYEEVNDLNELAKLLANQLRVADYVSADALATFLSLPIPMVFLKQFRDSVHTSSACFQSIQEAQTQMTRLLSLPRVYLNPYEIFLEDWASHPIRNDFGLGAGAIPVRFAFWANFDFEIGTCTEIWRAPNTQRIIDPRKHPASRLISRLSILARCATEYSRRRNSARAKKKVAIFGGGVAAVTAALQLTDDPKWRDQFESITIYQLGWRLGGKGATGRTSDHARVLEHGLHIWLGYYENAFRLIQKVYAEARRPPGSPIGTWNEAFTGQNDVGVMECRHGAWSPWVVHVTPNNGVPGQGNVPPLPVCIEKGVILVAAKWDQFVLITADATLAADLGARLAELAPRVNAETDTEELIAKLRELIKHAQKYRDGSAALSDDLRRLLMLIEMGATILLGLLSENINSYAELEKLERIDLARWLAQYNSDPWLSDLTQNPLLRGMYDFAFAYKDGDVGRPNFAAAPALRTIFRMCLTFKGSIFYRMNAGMGDTIFAPIYEVLCNRGVDVQFFHKVNRLELSADKKRVARVHIGRQATVKPTVVAGKYQPLVPVAVDSGSLPLPCWPDRPCYDQLVEGDALRNGNVDLESFWSTWGDVAEVQLEADKHFDIAVFGISLGSVPYLCHELVAASTAWANMVANVATVRTQSLQFWLKPNIKELGWRGPSPMLDAWVEPLDTWGDMTNIMSFESWGHDKPGSLAYFCGPMKGGIPSHGSVGFPARAKAEVEAAGARMLSRNIQTLWPSVPQSGLPSSDVVAKYARPNVDPSERYVLSLADSAKYRLSANGSEFDNLVIAGDWIQNGYNGGCVEAAVWSGIQAANAILGRPLNSGVITG